MSHESKEIPAKNLVDTLLVNPEKQAAIRRFFEFLDISLESQKIHGRQVDTVANEPLSLYPSIITETGLLIELHSTEKIMQSYDPRSLEAQDMSADAIATGFLKHHYYDTRIIGGLTDLSNEDPQFVHLTAVPLSGSDFGGVDSRQTYQHGGSLLVRGRRSDGDFPTDSALNARFEQLVAVSTAAEPAEKFISASNKIATEGGFVFVVNLSRNVNKNGKTVPHLKTANIASESFSKARARNNFEL